VKVRQNLRALHILRHQLKFAIALLLVPALQLSQIHLEYTALESLGSNLGAGGARDERLAHRAGFKVPGGLDVVPFLLQKRVGTREERGKRRGRGIMCEGRDGE